MRVSGGGPGVRLREGAWRGESLRGQAQDAERSQAEGPGVQSRWQRPTADVGGGGGGARRQGRSVNGFQPESLCFIL